MHAPTAEELAQYISVKAERSELERKAAKLKKTEEAIAHSVRAWMAAKDTRNCKRLDYQCTIADGRRYPKWQDEFVKALGADAAADVEARTPVNTTLQITPL